LTGVSGASVEAPVLHAASAMAVTTAAASPPNNLRMHILLLEPAATSDGRMYSTFRR
jgi:hypothetical protein